MGSNVDFRHLSHLIAALPARAGRSSVCHQRRQSSRGAGGKVHSCLTTKGQVVIPLRLRKLYHIEDGTRAIVTATDEGILLKPVTRHAINRLRGILKRKPGGQPFAEEWAEHQQREKEIEEAKHARCTGSR